MGHERDPEINRVGGYCRPYRSGPPVLAPRPASRGWDLLGLARRGLGLTQKAPSLLRLPMVGSGISFSRG